MLFFHPILSAAIVGLLSLATTSSAEPYCDQGILLGGVFADFGEGDYQDLWAGCNNINPSIKVSSYRLERNKDGNKGRCIFFPGPNCDGDRLYVPPYRYSSERYEALGEFDNRIVSAVCWIDEGFKTMKRRFA